MIYKKEHDNVFDELVARGYLDQATHEEDLKELLAKEKVSFYIGFDATADSLTIGHFIQIMVMMRMQAYGHKPLVLLGGGTTMIGDPSGRSDMRMVMTKERIDHNADRFYQQFQRFLDFSDGKASMENNADWLLNINFLQFMREVGVHFNVGEMIKKDAYKNRLERGLSFFEFSYMLLQSYDFLVLNEKHGTKLQMGGSDQWANIIGGADLVKKHKGEQVYGMTFKLLTRADGQKMGKSMGGAVWLDEEKTSPYELYQYLRNTDDRDVKKFLNLLTFLPSEEIEELTKYQDERINHAKEVLAYEIVKLVHGEEKAKEAQETSKALFSKGQVDENMPSTEVEKSFMEENPGLLNLLSHLGITKSNGEARRLIQQGGIKVNDKKVEDPSLEISGNLLEKDLIIQKGKKVFHRVIFK
ncbi:tyrosine--tRNA ligase [Helcococcus massiliensis]|uniref:tyrosine--tRNA ligase n=1 Tax=Helcococcus massiliensis TaxID=2040290 RepID=UPI000CDE7566|nr:tyrosine--tRNA ligase [Helcococcus massiliensis]